MGDNDHDADIRAIEALIARQFRTLSWAPGTPGDWDGFAADFFPGAPLYAGARPAKAQSVGDFVERMKGLAETTLPSLDETPRGAHIRVFGNVAVALAVCELLENGTETTRNVEALLLIKDGGEWRIAAQAWDTESAEKLIPKNLVAS